MSQKRSVNESASGIPKGIGISLIVCIITTLLGMAVSAYLIHKEMIAQESAEIAAILILTVSSAAGAFTAINTVKRMRLQMSLLSGVAYFLLLLSMTALFFGGQYNGIVTAVFAILGGSGIAVLANILPGKNRKKFKRKTAYR